MTAQDYLSLVRSRDFETLEKAWQDALADPGTVGNYRQTIEELCSSESLGIALDLATQMVEALRERGRLADAETLALAVIDRGAHSDGMARTLFELIEQLYSAEPWYPLMLELSGLSATSATRNAFREFARARSFTPGKVVYHRAGWGEGLVERLDCETRELTVKFASGGTKVFPIASALETLRPLADGDLRAMRIQRPEELERLTNERPAVLIRLVAEMFRGKATSSQVKTELCPSVVPAKRWASYWKKAKTAAANDPWLQIEGSKTRPTFVVRKKPVSLADEASRSLGHAANLEEAIAICRDYLGRDLDEAAKAVIVDLAQQHIEAEVQKTDASHAQLLDGILLLEEMGRKSSVSAADELRALLRSADGKFVPEAFEKIPNAESRTHAVSLLQEALGDAWADESITAITRFPKSVVEPVVESLQDAGHAPRLVGSWSAVAPYPRRHPLLTYWLARLYAEGEFDDQPDKPELVGVARCALHLCRIAAKERRGNQEFMRLRTRLVTLLVGKQAFLARALENISREDLTGFLGIAERGGQDFPQEVMDAILRVVAKKFPEITSKADRPFWEHDDYIYVTADGLARHRENHRILVDEKIPLNAKQIQQAASYGDLSENSEWEAAMEEQRKLTGRAEDMSEELRRVRLIEDQHIPEDVVAPGTRVTFTILDTGAQRSFRILGPWDCVSEGTINYRAPMALAMLGLAVGDEGSIETLELEERFRVDAIERIV